jgi:hypothetical protein
VTTSTLEPTLDHTTTPTGRARPPRRSDRRRERRRLREQDRESARVAELVAIEGLLAEATRTIEHGWVQGGWFAYDEPGRRHVVTAYGLDRLDGHVLTGACLVGAVVLAGGGPTAAHSQPVQRTLDLLWHTLHDDAAAQARLGVAPTLRQVRVRDLTRWNDAPGREAGEVVTLLARARALAVDLRGNSPIAPAPATMEG